MYQTNEDNYEYEVWSIECSIAKQKVWNYNI